MVHTGRVSDSKGRSAADAASTWMQVVFGGLGVSVALVALVIAYFAWVQPHSPDDGGRAAPPVPATAAGPATTAAGPATTAATAAPPGTAATAATVALGDLTPTVGAGNIRRSGGDLVMPCATGQSTDRQRIVEWDVLGRYTAMEAEVRVSKARDGDTPLQIKVFTDGPQAGNEVVTKGRTTRLSIPLDGREKMRIQLTCQFPDGEITLGNPALTHI